MEYDKKIFQFPKLGFSMTGHSRSASYTGFYIPELNWALDAGININKYVSHAFVTHGHLDHSFMVPFMLSRDATTNFYAPTETTPFLQRYMRSSHQLNDCVEDIHDRKYVISPALVGSEYQIQTGKQLYIMKPVQCVHSVPSIGYCFYDRRKKLKEEYKNLKGAEIAKLRKEGIEVSEDVNHPLFAFMGDTTIEVF
eukprot:TRINITY_DN7332_c0_g1_i2.p1 TRINITY_DN7332_c0_g1~~TRINITY_DN7332_c0_g1_i2.p1  ORF type:complete len:196 (-),score=39.89 TRINITY_DN7332_c0_g1_i2:287-874(-)